MAEDVLEMAVVDVTFEEDDGDNDKYWRRR